MINSTRPGRFTPGKDSRYPSCRIHLALSRARVLSFLVQLTGYLLKGVQSHAVIGQALSASFRRTHSVCRNADRSRPLLCMRAI